MKLGVPAGGQELVWLGLIFVALISTCVDYQLTCLGTFPYLFQIEVFKQGFNRKLQEELQEQLGLMWVDWTRKLPDESGDNSSAKPEVSTWKGKQKGSGHLFFFFLK